MDTFSKSINTNVENHWAKKLYSLPVYSQKQSILQALQEHQVVIVESNTGSGKTTQLPIILFEAGYSQKGIIGVTQPRRIAAFSVADVINAQIHQKHTNLSANFVRYKIRFDDTTRFDTKIKIMTDGVLLQEIKNTPLLPEYSVLIIDEAHERSLNIDFILGLLKNLCVNRPDLKIIISSATINSSVFAHFFQNKNKKSAPIIKIKAPLHEIKTKYIPPATSKQNLQNKFHKQKAKNKPSSFTIDDTDVIKHVCSCIETSVQNNEGDILVFLSGEKQIKMCALQSLPQLAISNKLLILPLYGRLDKKTQARVFEQTPAGLTKVVIATNIAETSITIDNIAVVIDSGRAKINMFLHNKFASSLEEKPISQSSAIQRCGRAGRTQAGTCYRLYTKKEFNTMQEYTTEEIYRTDLSEVVLRMAQLGIQNFNTFPFMSAPSTKAIFAAEQNLKRLEALDSQNKITSIGKTMCLFPLSPTHARIVVEAMKNYPSSLYETLIVIAFLTSPSPFLLPIEEMDAVRKAHQYFASKSVAGKGNDFLLYIHLFNTYTQINNHKHKEFCQDYFLDVEIMAEIKNVHTQLIELVEEQGFIIKKTDFTSTYDLETKILTDVMKSILRGLENNICIKNPQDRRGRSYINRSEERIYIHPGALLFDCFEKPKVFVAAEIVNTSKFFARSIAPCKTQWLEISAPQTYEAIKNISFSSHPKKHIKKSNYRSTKRRHRK